MRVLALCLVGSVGLSAACGGGAYEKSAASPPMGAMATPSPARELKKGDADRDADGIPDAKDAIQEERQLACVGGGPGCLPEEKTPAPAQAPTGGGTTPPAKNAPVAQAPSRADYLIYTATLTMAVYQVEGSLGQVEQIGRDVGGYLAVRQDRSITIRVPRARFDEAIKKIEATGDVVHRDIAAQDVTDEFLDTEIRLKNARAMRDRLQDLLQKAAVKEALEIEKELGRITQEIERMEGRLKLLKDKIAFSTITVNFDARASSLKTMPIRLPFAWLPALGLPSLLRLNETK
jgi:Domain of unknown function (DUF4349)